MGNGKGDGLVLGLDLGANSVGWALIRQRNGVAIGLVDLGARVFEAGVDGDIQSGQDESRGAKRRDARQVRRQLERRGRRHENLARVLQQHGLLPPGNLESDADRHEIFCALDNEIRAKFAEPNSSAVSDASLTQLPYFLRARALDHRLEPFELGRTLYHLGQRRGFLSNRKAPKDKDEDGVVKKDIAKLAEAMTDAGSRTLGEYFASIDPHEQRIRSRWTARSMYIAEFDAIWAAQHVHQPDLLTDDLREKVRHVMFFQRPLKSQAGLIGKCDIEEGKKRAPMELLESQRFRLLQRVNDLEIIASDFQRRRLTDAERLLLLNTMETAEEKTFPAIRKLLSLPNTSKLNMEAGGETRLLGNRTAARLREVFGERWDTMTHEQHAQVVEDLRSIQKSETLIARAQRVWGLNEEKARDLAEVHLDSGYCRLSRQALAEILPLLEQGVQYATARKQCFGDREKHYVVDLLPAVDEAPFELRNPAVHRALTEMRKVVNAILRKYGKPDIIRIELARDLKKSRKEREQTSRKNRQNEKSRKGAAKTILDERGIMSPKRDDILRVLLYEECGGICPYTGKSISIGALFGEHSQYDIEHIIPYSRCFDNSFLNKTLCYNEENRTRKCNKTPFEAYATDPDGWEAMLDRVRRFKGDGRDAKLRRFLMKSLEDFDEFTTRQLNDTRYFSTLAGEYLGLLYGGLIDASGVRRIHAGRGQITSDLRWAWNLNRILSDKETKSRDDHRHHAVDAVVIAMTNPATVRALSKANEQAGYEGRRAWWKQVPVPWPSFLEDVQARIDTCVVSHRVSRKVNGPLHEETFYSKAQVDPHGKPCVHVRKAVSKLSPTEVEAIVDDAVRKAVKGKLDDLGNGTPDKVFADPANHPCLTSKVGERRPIHKVRIRKREKTFAIGSAGRIRNVVAASNHHMEIRQVADRKSDVKWVDRIVDQYSAMQRLKSGASIVSRDGEDKFVFSLTVGDVIEMDTHSGRRLFKIRSLSRDLVEFCRAEDSRLIKDIKASGEWGKVRLNAIRRANARKVTIAPLGEVRHAND